MTEQGIEPRTSGFYAKFQYSLNILFCEPTEICQYNRVPEFRTMLTFTNYGPLKRSAGLAY